MPVSDIFSIAPILSAVIQLQPKSILDCGVGGGKYGVLCREVLDWVHGRMKPEDWQVVIEGIEGFEAYHNPAWGAYNSVVIQDFTQYYHYNYDYSLVLLVDSLEHVEKAEAEVILHTLVKNNRNVIVSVPLGECPQGACFNNEFERHRSTWTGEQDFKQYNYKVLHKGVCLVVLIKGEL